MAGTSDSPWLRYLHRGTAPTVVCFPHAGGAASSWTAVADAFATLRPDASVVSVQYPGRENRLFEAALDDIDALADGVVGALEPHLAGTLVFVGHSMGAVVAFETARRLEQGPGTGPRLLVASASPAPGSLRGDGGLHLGDDDALLAGIAAFGGIDAELCADRELMELLLPAMRADLWAIETYRARPGATVACPIVAFAGDTDPTVTVTGVRAWSAHTTGGFALRVLAGTHFYLATAPDVFAARLSDALADWLDGTEERRSAAPTRRPPEATSSTSDGSGTVR